MIEAWPEGVSARSRQCRLAERRVAGFAEDLVVAAAAFGARVLVAVVVVARAAVGLFLSYFLCVAVSSFFFLPR